MSTLNPYYPGGDPTTQGGIFDSPPTPSAQSKIEQLGQHPVEIIVDRVTGKANEYILMNGGLYKAIEEKK